MPFTELCQKENDKQLPSEDYIKERMLAFDSKVEALESLK